MNRIVCALLLFTAPRQAAALECKEGRGLSEVEQVNGSPTAHMVTTCGGRHDEDGQPSEPWRCLMWTYSNGQVDGNGAARGRSHQRVDSLMRRLGVASQRPRDHMIEFLLASNEPVMRAAGSRLAQEQAQAWSQEVKRVRGLLRQPDLALVVLFQCKPAVSAESTTACAVNRCMDLSSSTPPGK